MKQIQRSILFVFVALLTFSLHSCKKEKSFMSNASITGYDMRACVCCGGLEINIDNALNPNGNGYFLIGKLPTDFSIGSDPKFPIRVKIDWTVDNLRCFGNYVDILRIEKR